MINVNKYKLIQNKTIDFFINIEISNKIIENIKSFGKIDITSGLINTIIESEDEANEFSKFLFKWYLISFSNF